jgi:hypothetical protein
MIKRIVTSMILFAFTLGIAVPYRGSINNGDRERYYDTWAILQAPSDGKGIVNGYQECVNNLDEFTLDASASGKIYHLTDVETIEEMKDAGLINYSLTEAILALVLVQFNGYYTREDTSPIVLETILNLSACYSAPMVVLQGTEIIENPFEYFDSWTLGQTGMPFYLTPEKR